MKLTLEEFVAQHGPLLPWRDREIVRLFEADVSLAQIGRLAGLHTSSVARLLERLKLRQRKHIGRPKGSTTT
jgi:hypothetical protein